MQPPTQDTQLSPYISSNQTANGKFRKIKLKVAPAVESRNGPVAIATKRGYYVR